MSVNESYLFFTLYKVVRVDCKSVDETLMGDNLNEIYHVERTLMWR